MERFLRLTAARRAQAFQQASAETGWPAAAVEKDFWVTLVLRELFTLPAHAGHLTFKGGTSLSKAWKLIERFSEDVDLTLDREALGFGGDQSPEEATSGKERQRRLGRLREACRREVHGALAGTLRARLAALLPDTPRWTLEADAEDPDNQTLVFAYPRAVSPGPADYLRPAAKLEFGGRADPWPVASATIAPIAATTLPDLFDAPDVVVRALQPERTFWEKVMLLHEEQFRPPGKARRARMARHYYDVWRLIEAGVAERASADTGLFERVARHREVYFRQTWVDYSTLRRGGIQMLPAAEHARAWRDDYQAMRTAMFVDEPPPFEVILDVVRGFQEAFNRG